ncbi:tRNA-specific 2-thiouridylase [Clostridium tetanomorphum]|uniref:tRNA-specific 2-thiouridylase MnmA n=1 Tax=Clostridium tetanomorphum TaxID=1553 RepID=A0A923ECR1_CLOTT|nr:tRNA 2-thiouridine(34) synthase MnmA [Clostridium tetanomorphum]KAJ51849.1 tRNA-specific 2-thiouridylase MnmA [Clostridium tetanomorphum DSM 665]MBC2399499.1 tRNA 2-thiouridine(34) synthase MnmA [Clostridium tetanomorphum]MBP1864148.1 tRNA-specific 2-thiouridylase [Clostridium tetanomorphum]NRS84561.1 tRNA-specific 2-thiouridylase [Clostridium tetanomorphum]NRZ97775.1 tRNA-specific 2-thiouridylase [Clostridium tetanomorphum]
MKKKVVLGMSGGVDSSVAAYLLLKEGYEVIGVTMQIWQNDEEYEEKEGGCCSLSSVNDARRVAYKLGIPFYVMNFKDKFKEKVITNFIDEYIKGNTPNPCISCNKYIKFDSFLKKALKLGADYIATGHYAKIEKNNEGRFIVKKGVDSRKDQSYVLYNFTQFQLKHTLLPCGDYTKDEIRAIAKEIGLNVYNKKDSEEICFIPDDDHGKFINKEEGDKIKKGNFIDKKGNILGKHKGIVYYTIGQRKGLGISLGKPMYVIDIDGDTGDITLGDNKDLFKKHLIAKELNFIPFDTLNSSMEVDIKVRYSTISSKGIIMPLEENKIEVQFFNPHRAITRGQSVVFYLENILIGGGIIEKVLD